MISFGIFGFKLTLKIHLKIHVHLICRKRFDAVSYARKLVEGELDIKDIGDIAMDTENEVDIRG